MKTLNYLGWNKLWIVILCLQFSACEKEELAFKNVPSNIPNVSNAHLTDDSDWHPCGGTASFFLKDESGNAVPFGYVPAGQVSISASEDSLRLEIKMNAYWSLLDVAYKVSTDDAQTVAGGWDRLAFSKAQNLAEIRLPRPLGRVAVMQTVVQCQHSNLMGIPNYRSKLSIGWESDDLGERKVLFPLPNDCDSTAIALQSPTN